MRERWIAVAFILALQGCSEDSTPAPVDSGVDATSEDTATTPDTLIADAPSDAPTGPLADFCRNTFGAIGERFRACCTASDKMHDEYAFVSTLLTAITEGCAASLSNGAAKGRVTLDEAKAAECVAAFKGDAGSACGSDILASVESSMNAAACKAAIKGMQAAGAACAGDHECQDGLTCVGATDNADGACVMPPEFSNPCGPGAPPPGVTLKFGDHPKCVANAYCDGGTCVARVPIDGSCSSNDACIAGYRCYLGRCSMSGPSTASGPCFIESDCVDTATCVVDTTGNGTCIAKKAAGATCKSGSFGGSECKGICSAPDGGMSGTCASFCGSG